MLLLRDIEIRSFKGLESVRVEGCGRVNALVGKNNSGKSSILHAIDMAGLALDTNNWSTFQPKREIKDLFADVGEFAIDLTYEDESRLSITANPRLGPGKSPNPNEQQQFRTVLISPEVSIGTGRRAHQTPKGTMDLAKSRRFSEIEGLQILYAVKFYSERRQRGMTSEGYQGLIAEVKRYFPDIEGMDSERTEDDTETLRYTEYGRSLDIIYAGSGLKHFLDVLLKTKVSGASVVLLDEPEMGLHPDLQRRFLEYLARFAEDSDVQIFMATHSPVLLSHADSVTHFRIANRKGDRSVVRVPGDAIHTVLGDLGIRPSDVFNRDMCLVVEGQADIIFFEHVVRELYGDEFGDVAVGVVQYAGGAAEGIISGAIDVSNVVSVQHYTLWLRDRDARPVEQPSSEATRFANALRAKGIKCHIWGRRELEFYLPDQVVTVAQDGDPDKEQAALEILNGDQSAKFRDAAKAKHVCVPTGKQLRNLLHDHLTDKQQLPQEVRQVIDGTLLQWKKEVLGEVEE